MKNFFKKDKNTETPAVNAEQNVAPENGGNGSGALTKSKSKLDRRMILIICAACLAVVCIVLAIVLPICLTGGGDTYYTLKYDNANPQGVNVVILNEDGADVKNGWEVKSGVNVKFSLGYDGEAEGTPSVKINGAEVKPDGNGVYSFTMSADTVISISGVFVKMNYKVTFDRGADNWVNYSSSDFDTSEPITVMGGEQVTFDVSVSVYYKQSGYTVVANTLVVKPGEQGHYTFTVIGDTTVQVRNLEQEDAFSAREAEDGKLYIDGAGTIGDPYRIRKPIDLYAMADLIGDSFNQGMNYQAAYYRLENDIDMKGERLYIIGDGFSTSSAVFAGNFDGNNKTISNYYIADEIVEQSGFTRVFTPYLGLFGRAAATTRGAAEIYDLNLENFTIEITHTNKTGFFVGGLVGMAEGVNITNCSAKGRIRAVADPDYRSVMGGIVGYQRAVSNGAVAFASVVRSCSADVEIAGESGFIECAGGVVGHVVSYDAVTPAYVLNSYSTGDVYGAVRSGGIAGAVSAFSSVKNSYSTGTVEARSDEDRVGMEDYHYAYAGGIAGYVDYGAVISDSFSTGDIYANARKGASFAITSGTAAYTEVNSIPAGAYPAIVLNSYSKSDNIDFNTYFIQNTLKWDTVDWTFSGEYPLINKEIVSKSFVITVNLGSGNTVDGKNVYTFGLTDVYSDMSGLYGGVYVGDKMVSLPQYLVSDSGLRTYGYYFDSELTRKIPNSYVPTNDMTIYVGFVNYNDVAGTYYLQSNVNGSAAFVDYKDINNVYSLSTPLEKGAYIQINADGTLVYRNGVISSGSTYYYDGTRLTLEEVYVTFEEVTTYDEDNKPVIVVSSSYVTMYADISSGNLNIYDGEMYKSSRPLKAIKKLSGFNYGYYYSGSTTYLFNPDMTGEKTEGNITTSFTYSVNGNTVTAGSETINISTLTPFDAFYGSWEKSAGSNKKYTFDGKGNWTYEYFGYNSAGQKQVYETLSGTYSGSTLSNGKPITIKDGLLEIGGETYYKQNSFAGTWRFPGRVNVDPFEITFGGISALGYGEAVADYGSYYGSITLAYHAVTAADGTVTIELYNGDYRYGVMVYIPAEKTLTGSIMTAANSTSSQAIMVENVKLFLYDDFKGSWVSSSAGFELVNFNGLGNYDMSGNDSHLGVSGTITINGTNAGRYELINGKLEGSFVYNGTTYTLVYDEESKLIRITGDSSTAVLVGFDGWQNTVLEAADGTVYEFDGRGNISGNVGKVTVTSASGSVNTYSYGMAGGVPSVTTLGTLSVGSGKYTLGGVDLWLKNDFTGEWKYRDNNNILTLTVGRIGPDNGGFTASVSYDGKTVAKANYDAEHNEIYFEAVNFELSITVSKSPRETSLLFAVLENRQIFTSVCIKELDEFAGAYVAGDGGKIVFDGFGVSEFATGEALSYDKYGKVLNNYMYSYEADEDSAGGELRLTSKDIIDGITVITNYIFNEVEESSAAYYKDGKYYEIMRIDALYKVSAYLKDAFNTADESVEYFFDGIGGLVETLENGEKVKYNYSIISYSNLMLTYTLYVTDADGNIYSGELNASSTNTFKLTPKDRFFNLTVYGVDGEGKTDTSSRYRFDGNGEGTLTYAKGEDVATYTYKLIEDAGNVCKFEVVSSADSTKKFNGVLTFKEDEITFVLTEIK